MADIKEEKTVVETVEQEKAATMVEYALLVALIALIAIAAIQFLGTSISTQFSSIGSTVTAP